MENLLRLLNRECDHTLPDQDWHALFELCRPVSLRRGQVLIEAGDVEPDVYIVKEGVMRGVDFDGERERTISFGLPGTIFSSRHSFYAGLPSYYRVEACCDSVVLKVLKADYVGLIERNPRFAIWALHYAWCEQFYNELRQATVHNGTAEERYRHMLRTRPELTEAVSQRVIASYLGVTPEYLCRLKRRLLKSGLR
ncbi:MAG: Crp/Fnr family transcriptional regulator [Bacteroides sp.]|nr:Crp/Fnr family transcriptional regulator [Bacteroides sp.]MCM1095840.1 Crp/Fnr family transcriptional regulator [Terasakiella sp.]